MAVARTSKTMLNNIGDSGHPCLIPHLRENAFSFSPLRVMFVVGLSYMTFNVEVGSFNGEDNGIPLQYSCLENSWTEEPGRLQSMGSRRVGHD